jgi:hypothetical protein
MLMSSPYHTERGKEMIAAMHQAISSVVAERKCQRYADSGILRLMRLIHVVAATGKTEAEIVDGIHWMRRKCVFRRCEWNIPTM